MGVTMNAWDALSAGLAECYVTIDGRRYRFMQAINLEASIEKKKMQVPVLGRMAAATRAWAGAAAARRRSTTTAAFFGSCYIALRKAARICTLIFRLPTRIR